MALGGLVKDVNIGNDKLKNFFSGFYPREEAIGGLCLALSLVSCVIVILLLLVPPVKGGKAVIDSTVNHNIKLKRRRKCRRQKKSG